MKELHLTEGRGTGIPTIYKLLDNNNSPKPIIETDEQCIYFLTILPANENFIQIDLLGKVKGDQVSDQVSDQVQLILNFCLSPKSRSEILNKIGISNHTMNYKRHIEPLLDDNWLERTIKDNPKDRNQKYKTTTIGMKILKKITE